MNVILGFGSTEEDQRRKVKEWVHEKLEEIHSAHSDGDGDTFNEEVITAFKSEFKKYQNEVQLEYDKCDSLENKPERYFHFSYGSRIVFDGDTLFVKLKFWHINSNHPMSPDGIALFEYAEVFAISAEDYSYTKRLALID